MAAYPSILAQRIPWREKSQPAGQAGYSPWGHKELETTEQVTHSLTNEATKYAHKGDINWMHTYPEHWSIVTFNPYLKEMCGAVYVY